MADEQEHKEEENVEKQGAIKLTKLLADYADERNKIRNEIDDLSDLFKDVNKLSDNHNLLFRMRNKLITRKLELMTVSNAVVRRYVTEKKNIADSYRDGTKKEVNNAAKGMVLKNEFERNVYFEYDLKDIEIIKKTIDDQLKFVVEQANLVKDMVDGVNYSVQLFKMKKNL